VADTIGVREAALGAAERAFDGPQRGDGNAFQACSSPADAPGERMLASPSAVEAQTPDVVITEIRMPASGTDQGIRTAGSICCLEVG